MATLLVKSYATAQLFANAELASLTTTSYALAAGSGVSSNIYDNTVNLYPEADILISLGSFNPSGSPYVVIAFLWSPDGTNYPDPQTALAPIAGTPIWSAGVATGSSAKLITIPRVLLRPLKCKVLFGNVTGATLAATANSITIAPAGYSIA